MLWERLKEDDFETDVVSVVKEMCKTVEIDGLENIQASDFSEIYLFFDYDIHNNNLKKEHRRLDNRQKHWQGNIEHACSWNENAQKNHYN